MTIEPQPALPPPSPSFQFSLRTLLLLFVVLGSSLAVFGAWGIVVFGLVVGLAIYLHEAEPLWSWARLALVVIVLLGLGRSADARNRDSPRESPSCVMCQQPASDRGGVASLSSGERLFPAGIHRRQERQADAQLAGAHTAPHGSGCSLQLYDSTQPWDGPKNKTVSDTPIMVYLCPSDPNGRASHFTQTSYVAVVGPNAAWAGEKPRKLTDFGKDASHTIMLIEVTNSGISWAEPRDLSLDTLGAADGKSPALALTSDHGRREEFFFTYDYVAGVHVAMADGSVRFLRIGNRSPEDLRKMLQIGGFKEEDGLAIPRRAAPELAQHRRPGRVAAFGRHAADPRGAEQESPSSSADVAHTYGLPAPPSLSWAFLPVSGLASPEPPN